MSQDERQTGLGGNLNGDEKGKCTVEKSKTNLNADKSRPDKRGNAGGDFKQRYSVSGAETTD